jgi:hypothetical protein
MIAEIARLQEHKPLSVRISHTFSRILHSLQLGTNFHTRNRLTPGEGSGHIYRSDIQGAIIGGGGAISCHLTVI